MSLSEKAARYNKREFSPDARRKQDGGSLDFHPVLRVGDRAPDFTIFDLDHRSVRLSDLHNKTHVVFAFGCMTAPIFINDIPEFNRLHQSFAQQGIALYIVYVREAHAAENYRMHTSLEQKIAHARDLQRLENLEVPVLVDTLEGDAHQLYGIRPNCVWGVMKGGRIFYKSTSLIPDNLELVLKRLAASAALNAEGGHIRQMYSESWIQLGINRRVHERVLNRAGPSARKEVSRAFGADPVTKGLK